jgi:XTP/dITP diphosphohydrolase
MDDVPTGQPALALTHKVLERAAGVGLPDELVPGELRQVQISMDRDPENALRAATLAFVDTIRAVEKAVVAARGGDGIGDAPPGVITAEEWREHWPAG